MNHFVEVMMTPVTYLRCLLLAVALYSPGLFGQSTDKNFVLTRTYKGARTIVSGNIKDATQEVAYLDGLGRPLQSISAQASPLLTGSRSADLVIHTEYDASGRPFKQYAPYPVQGNGVFRSNAAAASVDFYNNASNFCVNNNRGFTLSEYEAVPDERVKKQYAAGSERAIEYTYRGNSSGEVKRYVVSGTSVQYPGDYGAGQLTCVQTKDENGNRTREYRDKTGSVVLRRVYLSDNDSDKLDTYYVYDDYAQLRFVLQPQFQDNANIDLYAFKYNYNSKGLVTSKYVPGGGTTAMVYDQRDRLRESTDGRGKITYYKYDDLNRITETGEKSGSTETQLSRVHYDTYSPAFGGSEAFVGAGGDYPGGYRAAVKGKQTVSATRILNPDGSYGSWLYATVYYDDRYNPIQTVRSLFDIGGTARERNSNLRRFDGRIEKELTLQQTGSGDYSVEKVYNYDHSDRQLSSRYIVKKGSDVKKDLFLSASRYNGIGQLKNKFLHSADAAATFREKLDYCYTPRNFLSKITGSGASGENFGVELRYTNPAESPAQYNGNIAEMLWKRGTSWVGYKLSYDRANRLTNSDGLNNNFRETVTGYDRNGNITGLQRVSNGSNIDNLTYDYSAYGNRLRKVTDADNNVNGFDNGSSGSGDDYAYDGNGNLTQDLNREIAAGGLRYNFNNLVREVVVGSNTLQYHFDASGAKLRMSNSNGAVNTKYAGAFEYNQGNYLTRIATEEGQISVTNNGNDFAAEYYLSDHLGNVRQVINESGVILQETEYYAFGLAIPRTAGTNKYTFLGREKQPETGWMDLIKRSYDPTTGRFIQVDPVTVTQEHLSVYQYGWNNPILRSDPNGDCPKCDDYAGQIGMMIGAAVMNAKNSLMTLAYNAGDALGITPTEKGMKWEAVERQVGNSYVTSMEQVSRQGLLRDAGGHLFDGLNATAVFSPGNGSTSGLLTKTVPDAVVAATIAKAGKDAIKGGVYVLREGETVVRSGRTINLAQRQVQHASDPVLKKFTFETVYKTDAYSEQRGLEHLVYKANPTAKAANGGYNKIGAISEKNPNFSKYLKAAEEFLRNNK